MRRVRLGDVLRLVREPVSVNPVEEYTSIGVRGFGRGIFHYESKAGSELGRLRFFRVRPGELVVSNIKAWEGAIAISSTKDAGTIASNRFLTYTSDPGEVDLSFLRYLLLSEVGLPLIQKASPGSADRNRTLAVERFEALEIPLPDIDEQRGVAAHLGSVVALGGAIGSLHDDSAVRLAALAPSLAAQPGIDDSGRIAAGWQRRPLGEVMNPVVDQIAVETSGSYPNLGVYSFGRGLFEKPPIEGTNTSAKVLNRVRGGQFLYSRLFAFEGAYAYVPDRFNGYFVSGEFPTFDVDPELATAEFIAAALRSPRAWEDLRGSSRGLGLRRQRVQVESLLAYEMWFPPVEVQQRLVAGIDRASEALQRLERSREMTNALVPSALNRAFAGMA